MPHFENTTNRLNIFFFLYIEKKEKLIMRSFLDESHNLNYVFNKTEKWKNDRNESSSKKGIFQKGNLKNISQFLYEYVPNKVINLF